MTTNSSRERRIRRTWRSAQQQQQQQQQQREGEGPGQQEEEVEEDEEEVDRDIYTYSSVTSGACTRAGGTCTATRPPSTATSPVPLHGGDELLRRFEHGSHYESAEGCYAKVVSTSKVRRIYEIISHNHFMHGWTVTNDPIQPTQWLRRWACVTR